MANVKQYIYKKGTNVALDSDFDSAVSYGKVKPGRTGVFWRSGLHWYHIPMDKIQRIYRRVEPVYGKLCCGGKSFIIEWLVLELHDGAEVVVHIGDEIGKKAENLLEALKGMHPQIAYGKFYT